MNERFLENGWNYGRMSAFETAGRTALKLAGLLACGLLMAGLPDGYAGDNLMSSFDFDTASGLPAPEWADDAGSSQQYFQFFDDSLSGPADVDNNPFGVPSFSVDVGIGQAAWLDPQNPEDITRNDNGGAWELEDGDTISFSIPVQGSFNGGSSLEFFVTAVAFEGEGVFAGFYSFPGFSIQDHAADNLVFQSGFVEDHENGEWTYLNWSGTVSAFAGNEISFVVSGVEPGTLALIDSFEAYVIPEPGAYAVLFGVFALGLIAYRHRLRR